MKKTRLGGLGCRQSGPSVGGNNQPWWLFFYVSVDLGAPTRPQGSSRTRLTHNLILSRALAKPDFLVTWYPCMGNCTTTNSQILGVTIKCYMNGTGAQLPTTWPTDMTTAIYVGNGNV